MIAIPHLLSFLATNSFNGQGHRPQPAAAAVHQAVRPRQLHPDVFIQYWSMRVMAYLAAALFAVRAVGRMADAAGQLERRAGSWSLAVWAVVVPFLMNTAGWMLTENGRQPWIVQGLMKTISGVFAVGQHDRDLDQPDRVRPDLHRAGRGRSGPDAALLPPGAAPTSGGLDAGRGASPGRSAAGWPTESHAAPHALVHHHRRSSGPGSSCWRDSTSASACCTSSSAGPTRSGGGAQSIGPFWDGNEVWLIVAGAATFAAFPGWYATMFSALYLALLLVLAALWPAASRLEFRSKLEDPRWRRAWTWADDRRQCADPAADRRRPRRPAPRAADQLQPRVTPATSSTC